MKRHIFDGGRRRNQGRSGHPIIPHILRGKNSHHARSFTRGRNVNAQDASMGVIAAFESRVQHAGNLDIIHKKSLPGQKARVFVSSNSFSNESCCHGIAPVQRLSVIARAFFPKQSSGQRRGLLRSGRSQ
jgi:hypothetical protein